MQTQHIVCLVHLQYCFRKEASSIYEDFTKQWIMQLDPIVRLPGSTTMMQNMMPWTMQCKVTSTMMCHSTARDARTDLKKGSECDNKSNGAHLPKLLPGLLPRQLSRHTGPPISSTCLSYAQDACTVLADLHSPRSMTGNAILGMFTIIMWALSQYMITHV